MPKWTNDPGISHLKGTFKGGRGKVALLNQILAEKLNLIINQSNEKTFGRKNDV